MPSVERPTSSPSTNRLHLKLLDFRFIVLRVLTGFIKLCLHRSVATRETLDGKVVGLVVGKTQVVL